MYNAKILIVDDEINILKTIKIALAQSDYLIDDAYDGQTACDKIAANKYDCILLDMRLPDIDGLEILRRHSPENVILITAHGTIENAVEAMKLGCVDFIRKPFEPEVIREAIHSVLVRKQVAMESSLEFDSYIQAAKLEVSQHQYRKAKDLIMKALELKPNSAEAFNFLGVMHEILGDVSKALTAYRTAVTLNSDYLPAKDNLKRVIGLDTESGIIIGTEL